MNKDCESDFRCDGGMPRIVGTLARSVRTCPCDFCRRRIATIHVNKVQLLVGFRRWVFAAQESRRRVSVRSAGMCITCYSADEALQGHGGRCSTPPPLPPSCLCCPGVEWPGRELQPSFRSLAMAAGACVFLLGVVGAHASPHAILRGQA